MSEIRFGRVEKWILKHAYLKTVKKDLPEGWKNIYCECRDDNLGNLNFCGNCLLKAEILANYFGDKLTPSIIRKHKGFDEEYGEYCWEPKYQSNKNYQSALIILDRAFKSLQRKGLIVKDRVGNGHDHIGKYEIKGRGHYLNMGSYEPTKIILTEEGREKSGGREI